MSGPAPGCGSAGGPGEADLAWRQALALLRGGSPTEALQSISRALALEPARAEFWLAEGGIREALQDAQGAVASYTQALRLDRSLKQGWVNLGRLEDQLGNTPAAARAYDQALMIDPRYPIALSNLGELFFRGGDTLTGKALLEAAVAADPQLPVARFNLARVRLAEHRLDDAHAEFFRAYTGAPQDLQYAGAYFLSMLCSPSETRQQIESAHCEWGCRFASEGLPTRHGRQPGDAPGNRLRVGYVSGDLNLHPASRFLAPALVLHDRTQLEVFAYYTDRVEDEQTARFRAAVDHWRAVFDWPLHRLVKQVESDRIDILIDLSGHTRGNRLDLFAHKSAPLQGEWLGYLHSSGLPTIDFRLGDRLMEGDCRTDGLSLMPDGIWCYEPYDDSPPVSPHEDRQDAVVFGSFNNAMKINREVIECWGLLLTSLPTSRLRLSGFSRPEAIATVADAFERLGVGRNRLEFLPKLPIHQYLQRLSEVDIALDPFPYGGGTTTFDSLWMGVAVVTRTSDRSCGRGSAAVLQRLGLPELIAATTSEYLEIARRLAGDATTRRDLRSSLRTRVATSALSDGRRFARALEEAYRRLWRRRCQTQSPDQP